MNTMGGYLLLNAKRVNITVSDFPRDEPIRVFTINAMNKNKNQSNEKTKNPAVSHCSLFSFYFLHSVTT